MPPGEPDGTILVPFQILILHFPQVCLILKYFIIIAPHHNLFLFLVHTHIHSPLEFRVLISLWHYLLDC